MPTAIAAGALAVPALVESIGRTTSTTGNQKKKGGPPSPEFCRLNAVHVRELSIPDSYEVTPTIHGDDRGIFLEWYRFDHLEEAVGHSLILRQANTSVSKRGVVRGIHFADLPPSQAKYVTVSHGAVVDYVIDIRVGSPTFGQWDSVLLDTADRKAIYIAEGLGHAFLALTENATVSYLVTDVFNAPREHGINPLDSEIALAFPTGIEPLVGPKDVGAPSLSEAAASGILPKWDDARAYYASLNAGS
jgi:dTDP-4-dehydrorhamnose 3,5-epimerase